MAYKKLKYWFDKDLAILISDKIFPHYKSFDRENFVRWIDEETTDLELKDRVALIADQLKLHLPVNYEEAVRILIKILGPENKNETGMFTEGYWIMPIAYFVEKYGLNSFSVSMNAIEEITKRNTGEYAVRPFLRKYPDRTIEKLMTWAQSEKFHLRRLASEGSRPKLPWSTKLDIFIDNPEPVFNILSILKEDHIKFVQKSVANNITDYLKVNYQAARNLLKEWSISTNKNTQWILKHATRKIKI